MIIKCNNNNGHNDDADDDNNKTSNKNKTTFVIIKTLIKVMISYFKLSPTFRKHI